MSAEVLTELVVKLGFLTDETEKKNFQANIGKIEKGLNALAKKAIFAGVAFAGMAVATANNMGKIERSARNIGTSSKNLQVLTHAFEDLGLGGQKAQGIIDDLNSKLTGVQAEGWAKGIKDWFGVDVKDANGQLRDTAEILQDVLSSNKGSRQQRQNILQQVLGIDEQTFKKLENGELFKAIEEQKRRYNNLFSNYDEASKQTLEFKKAFDRLIDTFNILNQKNLSSIAPELTSIFTILTDGVEVLAQVVNDVAKPAFGWIADFLKSIGIKVKKSGAQTAGGKMLAAALYDPDHLKKSIAEIEEKIEAGEISKEQGNKIIAGFKAQMANNPQQVNNPAEVPQKPYEVSSKDGLRLGERNNNPGNIKGENGFRKFSSQYEGLSALSYQLGRYGNAGFNTVGSIISKWAPPNENNTKAYIAAVAKELGVGANERLNMRDPRVIEALMNAIIRHENGRNIYDPNMIKRASFIGAGTRDRFGKDPWNLNQNVTINTTINGAKDPVQTGHEVSKQVGRTMDDNYQRIEMARNQSPIKFGGD